MFIKVLKIIATIFLIIFILGWFMNMMTNSREKEIVDKVDSIQGKVEDMELKSFDKGPFWYAPNGGASVFHFTYTQNHKVKYGWVEFTLFGSDWKMDYKY